jgi:hypothetical protein
MPVAHSGVLWRLISLLLLFAATAVYFWDAAREFPHGGSSLGLTYGIIGSLLILLLAFFGIRKRWYRSTFGTLEQWLQSHIYLGVLVLVILLYHTGGRFNDQIAVTALLLLAIVVASGIFGAILYVTVPRLLTEVESDLTVAEISEQLNQLGKQMARIASGKSPVFQRIHDELMAVSTPGWLGGWRLLFSRRRPASGDQSDWTDLLRLVPKSEEDDLRQLLIVSRQRSELLIRLMHQQRYKNILDVWLYVHIPFTIALLVFTAVHVVAVFYYGRLRW